MEEEYPFFWFKSGKNEGLDTLQGLKEHFKFLLALGTQGHVT